MVNSEFRMVNYLVAALPNSSRVSKNVALNYVPKNVARNCVPKNVASPISNKSPNGAPHTSPVQRAGDRTEH